MSDKDKKEARRKKRSAQMMGAVGDFAGSLATGLLAEAKQKGSGAGFAAAFAQGVAPIVDFGKIMRGKADPGTVLGRVGLNAMRSNAYFGSEDADDDSIEADAMNEVDNDPLASESGLGEESIVMSDEEVADAAKAAVETAIGDRDPFEGIAVVDRALFMQVGLGDDGGLPAEYIVSATNDLTNKYGPQKVGEVFGAVHQSLGDSKPTGTPKAASKPQNPFDQLEPGDRQVVLRLVSGEGLSDEDLRNGVNYLVNNYGLELAQEALKHAAQGKAK